MAAKRKLARGSARATIDHDEIRSWIEEHGGHPSVVKRTRGQRGPGILRVDFPGYSGEDTLEPIEWDEFFDIFEQQRLAFLYQDETGAGRPTRFNKFVQREPLGFEDSGSPRAPVRGRRSTGARATAKRPTAARATAKRRTTGRAPAKRATGRAAAKKTAKASTRRTTRGRASAS